MYWGLAATLGIEIAWREGQREIARESKAMSICETVQTQKQYYLCHMRSGYFPINRILHRERKRERATERERGYEAMSICETVKTKMVLSP